MATIDETFKNLQPPFSVVVQDHTRDACDRQNDVTITSTTDGNVILKPGETKYFQIRDRDNYTRSGGWYWKCGDTSEVARIRGADYVMAVRKNNGVIDWFWVTIGLG